MARTRTLSSGTLMSAPGSSGITFSLVSVSLSFSCLFLFLLIFRSRCDTILFPPLYGTRIQFFIHSLFYFSDHNPPLQVMILHLVIHSVLYFSDHSPQQTHIPELIQDQARNLPFSCSLPKVTRSIL